MKTFNHFDWFRDEDLAKSELRNFQVPSLDFIFRVSNPELFSKSIKDWTLTNIIIFFGLFLQKVTKSTAQIIREIVEIAEE